MFGPLTTQVLALEQRQRALDAERARVLAEWGASGEWADDGSISPEARLASETGISRALARERMHVSELLERVMPLTSAAIESLGWPKVKLLASVINARTEQAFTRDESTLLEHAERLSADQLAILVGNWKRLVDEDGANADADALHENQYVSLATSWDGMGFLKGRLDPEATAIVKTVLDQIADELYRSERRAASLAKLNGEEPAAPRSSSERAAEALVEMAKRAAATTAAEHEGRAVRPARSLVTVHLDVDAYAEVKARLADGTPIPTRDALRLACDAAIVRAVSRDGSVPLDLGRTVRDPTDAQRRAMAALWATCGHPTCDRPFSWCELHHVWHWEDGGPTDVGWLIPLCRAHHHLHHKGVFEIERRPDGTFVFVRADGSVIGDANPTISRLLVSLRALDLAA